jgi:hypothetical protein
MGVADGGYCGFGGRETVHVSDWPAERMAPASTPEMSKLRTSPPSFLITNVTWPDGTFV